MQPANEHHASGASTGGSTGATTGSTGSTAGSSGGATSGIRGDTTRSTVNLETIRSKVEKLLRKAADQAGTPEGEIFEAKAYELMAKYGVEASIAADSSQEAIHRNVTFSGSYTDLQASLLSSLAKALHCTVISNRRYGRSTINSAWVFGMPHHIDRVFVLFEALRRQMLAGAVDHAEAQKRTFAAAGYSSPRNIRTLKRSWMLGYITTVYERLETIEQQHADQYARQGHGGESLTGAVVLLNDRDKAEAAAHREFPDAVPYRKARPTVDPLAYRDGIAGAEATDLGQTRLRAQPRAISG